jgi:addiction module RelE/StbE family toxin
MKLRVAPTALNDLKDIETYIISEYENPSAAKRIVKKIISAYLKLPFSPYIGVSLSSKYDIDVSVRFIISGNYLVFYEINDDYIEIKRIIHSKRDYIKILFPD